MEELKKPGFLKPGDSIGIIAPARSVTPGQMAPFKDLLVNRGYIPVEGNYLYGQHNQFSGTADERLSDLVQMYMDPEVKAVFAARGGYGCVHLLNGMDWEVIRENPKWLVGFSDVTALHTALGKFMETIHGVMPYSLVMDEPQDKGSFDILFNILEGQDIEYSVEDHSLNISGTAKGILTGGNLSVLYSLAGTPYEPDYQDKILFLEDLDEYLYHVDRMIANFEIRGIFQKVAGLVIGDFSDMHDNMVPYGRKACEIIAERAIKYGVPTLFNFPAGHKLFNHPLIFGRLSTLTVQAGQCSLSMKND